MRSYSCVEGAPSPLRFQEPLEFTLIIISAFLKSKSFPASALARAEGYQRLESGAPENAAKYPPGRALPNTALDCEELHVASIVIAIVSSLYLFRSRPGLELRATGDDPATVDAQGLSVASIRIRYTLFGGLLVGLGGSWLMLAQSAAWHQAATTNGVGWIALALVVFAGWRPMRLIFGAILFGFTLQLPFTLQAEQITFIPSALMQMLPYLATLIALIALSRPSTRNKLGAPKSLGIPFVRDER